jgi:hypothetical protein
MNFIDGFLEFWGYVGRDASGVTWYVLGEYFARLVFVALVAGVLWLLLLLPYKLFMNKKKLVLLPLHNPHIVSGKEDDPTYCPGLKCGVPDDDLDCNGCGYVIHHDCTRRLRKTKVELGS